MARPRAADHDDKRRAILHHAAALFAAHGYDRASLSMLAAACGMSRALLYHYYTDKLHVLFDIIHSHLEALLAVTDLPHAPADPEEHLFHLADALLGAYRNAATLHHIQINQLHLLPPAKRAVLKDMERTLVRRFAAALAPCLPEPARKPGLLKPLTMSLFGMLNWNYLWFHDDGVMDRSSYAQLAVNLVVRGSIACMAQPAQATAKRRSAPAKRGRSRSPPAASSAGPGR